MTADHPELWPADSRECEFIGRVLPRFSEEEIWKGLCLGELEARVYCIGRSDYAPIPLSPLEFLRADRQRIFADGQIEVGETDRRRPRAIRRRISVPHWLYVTRASLDKFVKAQPAASVAAEGRAEGHLAERLRRNPNMTTAEAMTMCAEFKIGRRAFERIWPKARTKAGLPPKARAGRKSTQKSTQ